MRSYTREELYELVWAEPVRVIAERIGMSDVALAKTCRKHGVPLPPRGHWAKVAAGKRTHRIPLSSRGLGMPQIVRFGGNRRDRYCTPANLVEMEISPPPEFDEPVGDIVARVTKVVGKVAIPRDFGKAHRGIRRLLDEDAERKREYESLSYRSFYSAPFFDSGFERRRLRIINALMVALERNGAKATIRGKDPDGFSVSVGEQVVDLSIDHPGIARSGWHPSSRTPLPASHKLRAGIGRYHNFQDIRTVWEDDGDTRIESFVGEIVVNTIVAAELQYRAQETGHHEWLIKRKAQMIEQARIRKEEAERRELERLRQLEQARIDRLLGEAADFRRANDIRAYVHSVQQALRNGSPEHSADELAEWSRWALAQADRIDPVLSGRFLEPERDENRN